jgi:hypothetical protein
MDVPLLEKIGDATVLAERIAQVRRRSEWLHSKATDQILALLDDFAARLAAEPRTAAVEGGGFLVFWLRRTNLERLLDLNFAAAGRAVLDRFVEVPGGMLRAQPAGVVGHWVAGNVPTLSLFSWVLSLLTKNAAVVRVSEQTLDAVEPFLQVFQSTQTDGLTGAEILSTVGFVHFPRDNQECHRTMSLSVDARVVWGSAQAVQTVTALPREEHCTDLIFGPKYSLGVIDGQTQESRLAEVARAFVRDILIFDQRACSSPQTIFVEPSALEAEQLVEAFAEPFRRAAPKTEIDTYTATRIYTTRALWGLHQDRTFQGSAGADWTVCYDGNVELKEAVQSRTVFLTRVADIMDVIPLLTPKIQTIGLAVSDRNRAIHFADAATRRGVSRCVRPGLMNVYDLPWDGKLALSELVRWVMLQV